MLMSNLHHEQVYLYLHGTFRVSLIILDCAVQTIYPSSVGVSLNMT